MMASKTPRTTSKDNLHDISTENASRRSLRRHSGAGASVAKAPDSPSQRKGLKELPGIRSSPRLRKDAIEEEGDVTPRHLIQNMLMTQGTGQPITRKKKRMSDVMGPPLSSSSRRVARRRSSVSNIDIDDVTRKYTPRTNIMGFLEQASEETPVGRRAVAAATESHSTSQNISSFMLNEVGVSMLQGGSGSGTLVSTSTKAGRFRGKKGNLNIQLPQTTPVTSSQTPESKAAQATTGKDSNTRPKRKVSVAIHDVASPVSPAQEQDQATDGHTSQNGQRDSNMDTVKASTSSDGQRRKDDGSNVLVDMFGEGEDAFASEQTTGQPDAATGPAEREDEEMEMDGGEANVAQQYEEQVESSLRSGEREEELIQGGKRGRTPVSSNRDSGHEAQTPNLSSTRDSGGEAQSPNLSNRNSGNRAQSPNLSCGDEPQTPNQNWPLDGREVSGSSQKNTSQLSHRFARNTSRNEDVLERGHLAHISHRTPVTSTPRSTRPPTPGSYNNVRSTSVIVEDKSPLSKTVGSSASFRRAASSIGTDPRSMLPEAGDLSSHKQTSSSVVSRISSRFDNLETLHSTAALESEGPPLAQSSGGEHADDMAPEAGSGTATSIFEMPDITEDQPDSDENGDEEEGLSPLKTPHLPARQCTPNTAVSKSGVRHMEAGSAPAVGVKRKATSTRSAKRPRQGLPTSVVKATFSHFCNLRVSKEAIEEVEKLSEQYWKNMAGDLESYAAHAHRQTINESDFELLMKRQGFITDKCSLNTLIAKYLPLELRQGLIPIARSGNVLEPKI